MDKICLFFILIFSACFSMSAFAETDYPTKEKVRYVVDCMISNGDTPVALHQCSCAIDYIASKLPFSEYEKAETVTSISQSPYGGDRIALFKQADVSKSYVEKFKRIQADATMKCF